MKTPLRAVALILCCSVGSTIAQQTPDPMMKVDRGIQDNMKNNAEMNRVFDDQDKKSNPIRPYFSSALGDAQDFILAGKFDKAKKPIDKLHAMADFSVPEQARLHLIDAWYYGGTGDFAKETDALVKLMPIGAENIDSKAFVDAGIRLLKRQYNAKDYGGAVETLRHLRKNPDSAVELAPLAAAIKKLDDLSEGTQNIQQHITVNEKGEWSTSLLRPSFYLANITGSVSTVDFSCENKQTSLPYTPDSAMSPPATWGHCQIKIHSTPGAVYDFNQTVEKPAAK